MTEVLDLGSFMAASAPIPERTPEERELAITKKTQDLIERVRAVDAKRRPLTLIMAFTDISDTTEEIERYMVSREAMLGTLQYFGITKGDYYSSPESAYSSGLDDGNWELTLQRPDQGGVFVVRYNGAYMEEESSLGPRIRPRTVGQEQLLYSHGIGK